MSRVQPMKTCSQCNFTGKRDEFIHHSGLCWRCCPVPCIRITTTQHSRIPGFDPRDIMPKKNRGRPCAFK